MKPEEHPIGIYEFAGSVLALEVRVYLVERGVFHFRLRLR